MMALFDRGGARRRHMEQLPAGPIKELLGSAPPPPTTKLCDLGLLAVDVETTGLDPARDSLLSIGWIAVDGDTIDLGSAGQVLLRPNRAVGESAIFHGITDDRAATHGLDLAPALEMLARALHGRVLLAHHAAIETGFLGRAFEEHCGLAPRFGVVDTMQLQHRIMSRGFDDEPRAGTLRLAAARDQFGLPRYRAHDALTDALACAELYLVQVAGLGATTLKQVG